MYADNQILNLSKVNLKHKELLPEFSGLYYVVDQNNLVWYIGKANNISKRWQGKSHHRLYQLINQKKQQFFIYYQEVDINNLDSAEKKAIAKYSPHLNHSPVKRKNVRPTETLLRETLVMLGGYAFIIGVEPPRSQDQKLLKYADDPICKCWFLKKVINLNIIHLGIDINKLGKFTNDKYGAKDGILNTIFKNRKVYANKWEQMSSKNSYFFIHNAGRLLVNGYVIEVTSFYSDNLHETFNLRDTTLVKEKIKCLDESDLNLYHQKGIKNISGSWLLKESEITTHHQQENLSNLLIARIKPYENDPITLAFKEDLDRIKLVNHIHKINREYQENKRGFGSRSNKD